MGKINERKAGVLLSYLNLGIGSIIPFFYTPIMLRLLGQEAYGLYGLANSAVSYLGLLNFGMGSAIVRYTAKYRAEEKHDEVKGLIGLFLLIYGCMALLVCAVGAVLIGKADVFFAKGLTAQEIPQLRSLMRIMVVSTALSLPISVFTSVISAYERFVFQKTYGVFWTIATPVINLVILYAGHGAVGIAMAGMLTQVIGGVVYCAYCAKKIRLVPSFQRMPTHLLKEIWVFSAFVFLSTLVDMLYWATDKVLIGALIGSAAVAVYNIGGTFTSLLQNMAHAISNVFGTRVNILVTKNVPLEQISELLIRIGRLQYLVVSLVLSGYIVFGRVFIQFWAGSEYADAYYVALLTMIPLAVPLIQNIAFATILAQNKHKFRSLVYAGIAVFNVISTYLVLPVYGIIGAAVCTAAAFVLGQGVIMNIYYYRVIRLDIPAFWKNIGKMSIVPGAMMIVSILLIRYVVPIVSLFQMLIGAGIYTIVFACLSWHISMNSYEKTLILGFMKPVVDRIRKLRGV